jgi:hypothetical protein
MTELIICKIYCNIVSKMDNIVKKHNGDWVFTIGFSLSDS